MGFADRAKIITNFSFSETSRFNPTFVSLLVLPENDPKLFAPNHLFDLCTDIRFKSFVELLTSRDVRLISEQNIPFKTERGKTIFVNIHGTSSQQTDTIEIQFEDVTEIGKSIDEYKKQIEQVVTEFNQELGDIAALMRQRLFTPIANLKEHVTDGQSIEPKLKSILLNNIETIEDFIDEMSPAESQIETFHDQKTLTELLIDISQSAYSYLDSRDIKFEISPASEEHKIQSHDKIEAFFINLIYHISALFDENSVDPLIAASQVVVEGKPVIRIYSNVHDPEAEGIKQIGEKSSPNIQFSQSTSYLISLSKLLGYRIEVETSAASTMYKVFLS